MPRTIQFNRQLGFVAKEIEHVVPNGMLPSKLEF